MAKKNNDNIDDNDDFNDDKSEDINDADDNFGLPDIEYSPVNREEEKEDPAQDEPAPEEPAQEEPAQEKPSPFESIHKRDVIYSASSERLSSEEDRSSGHSGYVPPRKESNAPKIIILLGILLLVAAGIWYFGIYKPEQDRLQAQQEQELREEEARVQRERQAQADMERQQKEEADREAARLAAEDEAAAEAKTGSFETIPERTGRYYIVVASALDVDLATDYAKNLAQEGQNAKILAPKGRNQFHRVAVGDYENLAGAQAELNEMRSRYGDEVWVVKF